MALRLSTALRNFLMHNGSFKRAFQGGKLLIYSGSQPTDADTAASGTLLRTITLASGARTDETLATGTVELLTGAAGSVDTLTVNSVAILPAAVPFNTSLSQTATDVATAINDNLTVPEYTASAAGTVITIKAAPGTGTGPNGYVVASTCTTITKTDTNMAGGVAQANGVTFGGATSGALVKAGTWSGSSSASGTAGWFRLCGSEADDQTARTDKLRLDGNISTSGANLNMSSTIITSSTTTTIDTFTITEPAA